MKKLIAGGACFLVLLIGIIFWVLKNNDREEAEPIIEKPAVSAADNKNETPEVKAGYIVKDYCGNIAVFEHGKDTPFRTTGIVVKELPPADRALLGKGIDASNQEELNLILEDYCS